MTHQPPQSSRILVIDDESAIHDAYRTILCQGARQSAALDEMDAALFGTDHKAQESHNFQVDMASQGKDGLAMLKAAMAEGRPYRMAFVDMRMPPGWDGIETVENLWKADPDLEIVICTAFSDHPWNKVVERLGQSHRLLLLRKPFDASEVWQLARSLTQKRTVEETARANQSSLEAANALLRNEIEARQTIEGQLKYDSLTQLPNRLLLYERIERCILRSKREPSFKYAVLFLDLDDFKIVNDTLGHAMGDYLLVEVGKRLKLCLRELDTAVLIKDDVPARLGGDEFVVLLEDLSEPPDALKVGNRIQESLREIEIAGHHLHITASLGCAIGSKEHLVPDDILRDADAALYQAKTSGKGKLRLFDESIRDSVMSRQRLSNDLATAISQDQLRVLFQPIVSLDTGVLEGFEALVRWQHPEMGVISPGIFIPLAEQTGEIHEIGQWVLRESCQQLRIWRERFPARQDLSISVNVSVIQLTGPRFAQALSQVLAEVGLEGKHLCVEITESVFINNVDAVCQQLAAIRELGVQLHLDDFGTGFSSLSSFHKLPIDAIKIDRSFVSKMGLDGCVANIVQAIQQMATNRNLRVIAEGIETLEQLAQLQTLGCTSGQGYYLSRPVDAVAAQAMLLESERYPKLPVPSWPQTKAA